MVQKEEKPTLLKEEEDKQMEKRRLEKGRLLPEEIKDQRIKSAMEGRKNWKTLRDTKEEEELQKDKIPEP